MSAFSGCRRFVLLVVWLASASAFAQTVDLRVSSITDSIDPVTLGTDDVLYTVNVVNNGSSSATNPVLTVTMPTNGAFQNASASNGGLCVGPTSGVLTCSWSGTFAGFNSRSASILVTPTAGGTMTISGTITSDQPDSNTSNDTASTTTTVNSSIDLRVSSVTDSIDPITLGTGNVTYTVSIINDSTSKGTNPKVDITLPATATYVSHTATNSGTCTGPVSNVLTCSWSGDFPSFNGRSATVTVTPIVGGTMTVSATVSGDQPEADGSDNTASANTTVNASIDLRVSSITDSIDPITLGTGNVTYTVSIINDSTSKGTNPKVDITLPSGATFVSSAAASGGTCTGPVSDVVTCSWAGDFAAFNGRSATVTVTPTVGGTMTVSATVSGDQPEADGSDNTATATTTVNASIDLRTSSITDSIDPITLGTGDVTYTVSIINDSTSKATNPKVDINLPPSATYVSHTASNSGTCTGPVTNVLTCSWAGDFAAFNGRSATVTVTPTVGGTMTISATVSGDQPEADATDNTFTTTTTVNASIDLRTSSISDSIDPITLGTGNVTYTVSIINDSTSKATNAKVDITLPASATYVSSTASNSGTCTGPVSNVLTCNWAGDLNSFNGRSVTVTVTPTAGGTMTISATVSGDQPEADGSDNTFTTTTTVNAQIDLRTSSITDSIDPITLGTGNVIYTVNIINDSTSKATNAKIDINLPSTATYVSSTASNSGTCTGPVSNVLTCNWAGDLNSFNGRSVTVTVTPTAGGTMTISGTVSGDQPEADGSDNTFTTTTTVNAQIDLRTSSITDSIDPITLGTGNVVYTVNIINDSTSKATNAKVDITLPASATYVSYTATNSGTCTGPVSNVLTCNWAGDLNSFNGRTATVTVTPTVGGTMTISATVGGDQPEADATDNTFTTTTTVNANIDLQLTVNDSPDPRVLGAGNVTYTVSILNNSTSKGTNPAVAFTMPSPVNFVSATPSNSGTCAGPTSGVLTCNWSGDLNSFNGRSITIIVTPTNVGQLSATATVSGDQPDGNTANNTEVETTNINPSSPPTITSFAPASGPVGTTVVLTGTNFFSTSSVKFNGFGATFIVDSNTQITATVPASATTGVITVTNASGTANSVSSFTVTPAPDLTITKTASAPSVATGSAVTYTIAVSNSGAGAANDVTVTDTIPAGTTLTTVSGSGWTCSGNPTVVCTRGALAPGAAPNITIDIVAPSTGTTITNTATVSTTTPQTSTANDSSSVNVSIVGCPTTPPITAPATVCASSVGHTASIPAVPGATYSWTITNGVITSLTTNDMITFDAGASGPVTLGVTVFVTSCPSVSNSFNVAVATPTATITPSGPTTFCTGGNVTLTANNGASYLWSNGATTQSITVNGTGSFTVAVTDATGCTATSAATNVTALSPIVPSISASGPLTFCDGGSVTLDAGAGFASYLWSNGATTRFLTVTSSETLSVTTSDGTCSATSSPVTVTVNPAPAVSITHGGPLTFCQGGNVTLDAGGGYASYLWSNGATTQAIVATATETFTVTVTDSNGCGATSAPIAVTVNPNPTVNISGPTSACSNATLTADPGFVSYLWSNGATTQSISVTSTGTYTVNVTDANGCSGSDSHAITINTPPAPAITGPLTACDTATLDAGGGYASYLWSNGATTQSINVTSTGTYTVNVTDANGCSGSDSHTVTITTTPSATITPSGPTTFCDGGSVTLTASAAASYLWSNGATTQSINVSTAGTFTVTTTNGTCNAVSAPVTVTINALPTPTILGPLSACDTALLDAGAGYVSYLWSNGATTQTINVTTTGTYSVTVTDGNGCSGSDAHAVTIENTPSSTITTSGPTTFCAGGSVTLTASAAGSYLWSNGATTQSITVNAPGSYSVQATNGACSVTSAPVVVSVTPLPTPAITGPTAACDNAVLNAGAGYASYLWSNGATTQSINVSSSGNYSVTVVDANGCSGSDTHNITITTTPVATITPIVAPASGCSTAMMLVASAGTSWLWSNGATSQSINVTASGSYSVTVSNGACSATSAPYNVNLPPPATLTITGPSDACPGQPFTLTASLGFNSYLWSNGATAPSMTTSVPGTYTVKAFGPNGCQLIEPHTVATRNAPDANISALETALPNSSGNVASVPQFAGATYLWSISNGTITSGQGTASITFDAGSSGTIALAVAVSGNGCSANGSASVTITSAPPECNDVPPSLLTPANNASIASPATFAWSAVGGAIEYELWINTTLALTTSATSATLPVPPGPSSWHVVAKLAGNCAPLVSADRTFTVQPPPDNCATRGIATLIAPANNATVNTSNVELRWSAVANSDGYRIHAAIDGATPLLLGTTTATSFIAHFETGIVDWSVEALFDGCASTQSATSRFTIPPAQNCGIALPELVTPANGSTTSNGNVMFQWTAVPNATSYELWLALDHGTPTLAATTTSLSLMHSVAPGALQWFVRANLNRCPSRDSATRTFTFTPPPSCDGNQRPIAIEPLLGARVTSPVMFSWTNVPNATHYELFVDDHPRSDINTTLPTGEHHWFVRAYFEGCAPQDSAEQLVIVVPTPPACAPMVPPVISAPGQVSSGVELRIQWNEVPGATDYQLQLATTSNFADAEVIDTDATQHSITRTNDGTEALALFARVRARDARCIPSAIFSPFGPASAFFILPTNASEAGVPLTSDSIATFSVPIGAEFGGQTFTATVKEPWLSVAPSSGIVPAGGTTLSVFANTSTLGVGTHLGTVFLSFETPASNGAPRTNATTFKAPTLAISKVTPVTPAPKSTPPPDALIIPAVAHASGINSQFQSDVRVTNSSAQLLQYQVTFTPTGSSGLAASRQTTFSIDPGRTIALDDVLRGWFGTGGENVTGSLEVRPLTNTETPVTSNSFSGLANLVTFAASRTFNVTSNGTFGQYIPAIPFAKFIGGATDTVPASALSLQQIAQSDRYRTNLGIVEGSGDPASLLVKVFGSDGAKLKEFPVNLAGGEHTQLNSFLATNGVGSLSDGRVEISVVGGSGKVTAYASVLDNQTSDPLLVTPVTLSEAGAQKWVVPGVADLNNGIANWQTDMRLFNAGTSDVETTLTFISQNGGTPRTQTLTIPAGQVKQFDKALASIFGAANDGGAIHVSTATPSRLVATARTYNQTTTGTYGQFISGVTPNDATGVGSRPLQILQVEETNRFRSNIGLAEVTGNAVKLEVAVVPPDGKITIVTEVQLQPNEFRQINSLLASVGLADTYNARVSVRAVEGSGRVTAYASVIDMLTNDPTYVPAQ